MDTSWWPAVAAVVAVALLVLVPRRRTGERARPVVDPPHGPGPPARPEPGELWALADGRPCLVLGVRGHGHGGRAYGGRTYGGQVGRGHGGHAYGHGVRVAWITGKYDDRCAGVIPLPPGVVGARGGFLEADRVTEVSVWEFSRRLGTVDPAVWDEVKGLGSGPSG